MQASRLVLILLGAGAAVSVGAAGWLYAPDLQRLLVRQETASRAAVEPPAAPAAAPAPRDDDPLGDLQSSTVETLTEPQTDLESPFLRVPRTTPAAFCRSLGALGLRNPMFQGGVYPLRSWTCITDLLKPAGDAGVSSSVFVTARGDEPDRLDAIRFKLNLVDPPSVPVVKTIAKDLLTRIYAGLGWELPQEVGDMIDAQREGEIKDYGVSFSLKREFGPAQRYNLFVAFPPRLGAGGEDSFVGGQRRPVALPPDLIAPQPGAPATPGAPTPPSGPNLTGAPQAPRPIQ